MPHLNWPAWLPQEMIQSLRLYRKEGMLLLKRNMTQTLIIFIGVTLSCICFGGTVCYKMNLLMAFINCWRDQASIFSSKVPDSVEAQNIAILTLYISHI